MAVTAVDAVTGKASVTKPTEGNAWATYKLDVCEKERADTCLTVPDCAIASAGAVTVCPIEGAVAETAYTVKVTALEADGTRSSASAPAEFTTPQHT